MDIENFIAEFKKTFVYDMLSMSLKDEQLFEHVVDDDGVFWFKEQTRQMWLMWEKAKAQAVPEGFVLVPKECPDPIFADKLFDHLCEKAHGEFGDDQMIFFSDIDESAIWQLMIDEASQ